MQTKRLLVPLLLAMLPAVSMASHDDAEAASILAELEVNRRAIVEENMNLAPEAAARFWPVYDAYRAEIAELDKQGFKLLREFRDHFDELDDQRSGDVIRTYFDLEKKTITVKENYVKNFDEAFGTKQTLRFYQIENKIDSIIESDISAVTPLVPQSE